MRIPSATVPPVGLVWIAPSTARMHATAVAVGLASRMEAALARAIGQAQGATAALRIHATGTGRAIHPRLSARVNLVCGLGFTVTSRVPLLQVVQRNAIHKANALQTKTVHRTSVAMTRSTVSATRAGLALSATSRVRSVKTVGIAIRRRLLVSPASAKTNGMVRTVRHLVTIRNAAKGNAMLQVL